MEDSYKNGSTMLSRPAFKATCSQSLLTIF